MTILKKKYEKTNYTDVAKDLDDFLEKFYQKKKLSKKISKKSIENLNILKYFQYVRMARNLCKGTLNRDCIQQQNIEYHPYYFIEKNEDELIIVFRGTSNYNDVFLDYKHYQQMVNNIVQTHITIVSKILFYYGLINHIQEYDGKKVTIVGFSLGAVLGSYLLLILKLLNKDMYNISNVHLKLYAFACPVCIPECLQKYINKYIIAVVNEKDPIVCFRSNQSMLFTVGGNHIYNFVKNPKTKKVECFQQNYKHFVNRGIFYKPYQLSSHRTSSYETQLKKFFNEQ